jgi:hypothetical protein
MSKKYFSPSAFVGQNELDGQLNPIIYGAFRQLKGIVLEF